MCKAAIEVTKLNAEQNLSDTELKRMETMAEDCFSIDEHFDTIIFGDMFYDDDFCAMVEEWLLRRPTLKPFRVLIGDPGRQFWTDNSLVKRCKPIEQIPLR